MTRMPGARSWLVLGLCCASCGEDESARELVCGGLCASAARCGLWDDEGDCARNCEAEASEFDDLSPGGASEYGQRLSRASCAELDSDVAYAACWDTARAAVAGTRRARDFCGRYSVASFECGYSPSLEECTQIFSMWSDRVLGSAAKCLDESGCDAALACVNAVFEAL